MNNPSRSPLKPKEGTEYVYHSFCCQGRRPTNQDCVGVLDMPEQERKLFVICDGMGAYPHSDVASHAIVASIVNYWKGNPKRRDSEKKVLDAIHDAQVALDKRSRGLHSRIGTTMVMVSIEKGIATIAHLGDSRAYVYNSEEGMKYVTEDHVCETGGLTRCFFSHSEVSSQPGIIRVTLSSGDYIFLCTDGTWRCFDPAMLESILRTEKDDDAKIEEIVKHCEKHSFDNYSGILIKTG